MKTESKVEVLQKHTDELGHLNHVQAVLILELARDDWYAQCGLWDGRTWTRDEVLGTVVVNINYNYRLECFLGEQLVVTTAPAAMGTKSFTVNHEIIKPDGQVAIDGQCTSVVMDMSERGVIAVPESLARYLPGR